MSRQCKPETRKPQIIIGEIKAVAQENRLASDSDTQGVSYIWLALKYPTDQGRENWVRGVMVRVGLT